MENLFLPSLFMEAFPKLLSRLHITLYIVLMAMSLGLMLGSYIALVRLYRVPLLSQLAIVYVSFIRGIPILVLLYIVYIGLPLVIQGLLHVNINRWDTLWFVMLAYVVNSSAFLSEIIRSAVAGVDKGQVEAAYAVGMTRWQAFRRIVLPQAFEIALPALGNNIVALLKDTSLAYTLGVIDMIGVIKAISSNTYRSLEAYAAAAVIFFALSLLLEQGFKQLEKRLGSKQMVRG